MKVLVTGAAGFIGYFICKDLLDKGHEVVGLDNINDYYSTELKFSRLAQLGIRQEDAEEYGKLSVSQENTSFKFVRMDLEDREKLPDLFRLENFDVVCNMAAQAGVRYSLQNPESYVDSNVVGFLNILESCRHHNIKHLVYASSSSVYGMNQKIPFEVSDRVDQPISLYAATKKSNELMAYTYSHLYKMPTTGLRFFTVYGPWGRPDMALFLFTKAITAGEPINVFNHGDLERDFTYIDDIVEGVTRVVEDDCKERQGPEDLYKLYNIGNSKPVRLMDFVREIEKQLGKKAKLNMLPMQPGDVERTWADTDALSTDYGYTPKTPISKGIEEFVNWYASYYSKEFTTDPE